MYDLFQAVEWDEDPFEDMMGVEDIVNMWDDTITELQEDHFAPEDALIDGEAPDVVMVGYGLHIEALPAALTGLYKVMADKPEDQSPTEAFVRGWTLFSQLRILVAMYETYTNLGVMERVEEVDDLLPRIHSLLDLAD